MPFKVFTNGVPLPASDLNDYLMEQSIATFANSAARTAAITSPVEGQFTYLASTNALEFWDGAAWATAGGGGPTLISTTTLTGASVTLSSIPQDYKDLYFEILNYQPASTAVLNMRFNGLSTGIYMSRDYSQRINETMIETQWEITETGQANTGTNFSARGTLWDYTNTSFRRYGTGFWFGNAGTSNASVGPQAWFSSSTAAITSLTFFPTGANFTAGTVKLYGVK